MAPNLLGMNADEWKLVLMVSYVLVWGLVALLATVIVAKLLRALFRLFRTVGRVLGETTTAKLISLGLASFFFPKVIPGVVLTAGSILWTLVEKLPNTFSYPADIIGRVEPERVGDLVIRLMSLLLKTWTQAFTEAFRVFWEMPITDGVLMVATGAVFGLIFREAEQSAETGSLGTKELWLVNYFRSMKSRSRQNLAFIMILAIAGYLSIAAIAAIPALTEASIAGTDFGSDKLKQRLDALREEVEGGIKDLGAPRDPFDKMRKLQQALEAPETPPAGGTAPRLPLSQRDKTVLATFLKNATEARDGRLKAHAELVDRLKKQNVDEAHWLNDEYQANTVERKGRREAVRYYFDMVKYYRLSVRQRQSQIEWSASEVERIDREAFAFDDFVSDMVKNTVPAPAQSTTQVPNTPPAVPTPQPSIIADYFVNASSFMAPLRRPDFDRYDVVPARPELGSYLGPFQLVASWLLRTESLSLALIVGMIGFGLLGSASSSFIREKVENASPDQPLVRDLSGVIIRGCSAAVVVFLAAKGGLAIFGSGAADPNPYVLLLTCLVAAVFSDAVWERAQDWFKRLGDKRKERQKTTVMPGKAKRSEKQKPASGTAADAESM